MPRAANVIVAYNNYYATQSVPLLQELRDVYSDAAKFVRSRMDYNESNEVISRNKEGIEDTSREEDEMQRGKIERDMSETEKVSDQTALGENIADSDPESVVGADSAVPSFDSFFDGLEENLDAGKRNKSVRRTSRYTRQRRRQRRESDEDPWQDDFSSASFDAWFGEEDSEYGYGYRQDDDEETPQLDVGTLVDAVVPVLGGLGEIVVGAAEGAFDAAKKSRFAMMRDGYTGIVEEKLSPLAKEAASALKGVLTVEFQPSPTELEAMVLGSAAREVGAEDGENEVEGFQFWKGSSGNDRLADISNVRDSGIFSEQAGFVGAAENAVEKSFGYSVEANLVIQFASDELDQSPRIIELLSEKFCGSSNTNARDNQRRNKVGDFEFLPGTQSSLGWGSSAGIDDFSRSAAKRSPSSAKRQLVRLPGNHGTPNDLNPGDTYINEEERNRRARIKASASPYDYNLGMGEPNIKVGTTVEIAMLSDAIATYLTERALWRR